MGGFTPPLGQRDPCALTEPCTKPCTTATPLPCMAHLCFIPHPLTGEEAPHQGGPSVMVKQLCDSSLGISAIPFLRSLNKILLPGSLASLFFVVGMLRCPEPLMDRVQRRKVAFSPQTQLRAHNHFPGKRPNALIAPPWADALTN